MSRLFTHESSDPKWDAQRNLCGRTHYVDDDTLRSFHARVLSSHVSDGGLLFAIVESSSGDAQYKTRIYRPVIFDMFGYVLHRPSIEESFKTSSAARKAMWTALDAIDAAKVTREGIERQRAANERELAELSRQIDAIEAKKRGAA